MGVRSTRSGAGLVVRHGVRAVADLVRYAVRTGRWWLPVVVVLAAGSILVLITKLAVPAVVYTLF